MRDKYPLQILQACNHLIGNLYRIGARLLGNGECDGRMFACHGSRCLSGRPRSIPDVLLGLVRAATNVRHITQIHRVAVMQAHHKAGDLRCMPEQRPRLDLDLPVVRDQLTGFAGLVGLFKRGTQIG